MYNHDLPGTMTNPSSETNDQVGMLMDKVPDASHDWSENFEEKLELV